MVCQLIYTNIFNDCKSFILLNFMAKLFDFISFRIGFSNTKKFLLVQWKLWLCENKWPFYSKIRKESKPAKWPAKLMYDGSTAYDGSKNLR